jgi:putrescine importer
MSTAGAATASSGQLRRVLRLPDLIFYGLVIIQPTAPMPIFGVTSQVGRGHVVTALLIAMVAMLFTAISYGRMARVYPSAGSAYSYVGEALHPAVGFLAGWSIILDYVLNPIICTIWCSKATQNFVPFVPYWLFVLFFALLFTQINLRGVEMSAQVSRWLTLVMCGVVAIFLVFAVRAIAGQPNLTQADFLRPFYDPTTFSWRSLSAATAVSVLTYIGFDSVSTLSEEVENPRRNILLATVLTCILAGALASVEAYAAQMVWPDFRHYPDVDTAFVHVAGRAGGPWLFVLVNAALIVATVGSGFASQMAAARLLFGMGRDRVFPSRFFGTVEPKRGIPRNNVLLTGAFAVLGGLTFSYQLGAEMLNFGAFIAFMGVNLAALVQYCVRDKFRSVAYWLPPSAGFLICFYIWLNLSIPAKLAGSAWLAVGLVYAWSRGLFRAKLTPATNL